MTLNAYLTTAHATTECDNEALLEQAAEGDQLAWRRLVEKYDGLVKSVARSFRLQSADVFDVAQMTWMRLLQNMHTIHHPERLAGWLAVTATRESLAVLRKASRQDLVLGVEEVPDEDPAADFETSVTDRDAARGLWGAVAELSPRRRSLLLALFRDELDSYSEVAAKCSVPIGSIGPTRARALAQLQQKLAARSLGPADL
ncbi:RNA polymerase sigma factor [Geodermatophilus sabuli]|uniref:RNA polymerase sigma factor, sigma-70 family n=1 Tax=Geodermatophilus sabuli TaxID=1564158 RepID=A0A285EEK3_9ACTN|nr:sigma-70 family RNA polymerase sigma factor [Geodermatophilus sabuli]MBB3084092.1 RNA polymerase sigma factor (sigma-70 family) [Geodermatophilus sabuli]SNX96634.1 RNA polymerase sigma factor, sigma-70 family [Geodermatophilus sabuli]